MEELLKGQAEILSSKLNKNVSLDLEGICDHGLEYLAVLFDAKIQGDKEEEEKIGYNDSVYIRENDAEIKITRPCLAQYLKEHRFGQIYRYYGYDVLEETKYLSYSSLHNARSYEIDDPEKWDELFLIPDYLSYGDYDRSTAVERSNHEVFLEKYRDLDGIYEINGGYNSHGIAIRLDTLNNDEMFRLLSALQEYPIIDEGHWSNLEHEMIDEAWKDHGYNEVIRGIEERFDIEISRDLCALLVNDILDSINEYPFIEAGGIVYLPVDKIIEEIELEDVG